jgi:hypothetical protein
MRAESCADARGGTEAFALGGTDRVFDTLGFNATPLARPARVLAAVTPVLENARPKMQRR